MAASLLPFWEDVAPSEERRRFFHDALDVACGLDDPELAAALLKPFRVEALTPGPGRALVALLKRYGEEWTRPVLGGWCGSDRPWVRPGKRDRLSWLASLPRLCQALRKADDAVGTLAARRLLTDQWAWLQETIEERRGLAPPSRRDKELASLARPILGFLESTAVVEAGDLRDAAVSFLEADDNEPLLACLVRMLRAGNREVAPEMRAAAGLDAIARHCVRRIAPRLERPARGEGDWSIDLPEGCGCELCTTLGAFLADPDERRFEWPIAKAKRMRVHRRLDAHELPVRHETRRSGSPYTLVLTKTKELFAREAAERRRWQADLDWLARLKKA